MAKGEKCVICMLLFAKKIAELTSFRENRAGYGGWRHRTTGVGTVRPNGRSPSAERVGRIFRCGFHSRKYLTEILAMKMELLLFNQELTSKELDLGFPKRPCSHESVQTVGNGDPLNIST